MICDQCHYQVDCGQKPDNESRCRFYVKGSRVERKADSAANPMDTAEFDGNEFRRVVEEIERRR